MLPSSDSRTLQDSSVDGGQQSKTRETRTCRAVFFTAPGSNHGKTTVTAAYAHHFKRQGLDVRVFKAGPDFLDPMILERASGNKVHQLDQWMMGEERCRALVFDAAGGADLIIVEGVMGFFDGTPSSADLCRLLQIPAVAVIDASGVAQTFHAIALGLSQYRNDIEFAGAVANCVGSSRHASMIMETTDLQPLPVLACMPKSSELALPSRHLGLMQASEINELQTILDRAADCIKDSPLGQLPKVVSIPAPAQNLTGGGQQGPASRLRGLRIAVALDSAFSFVYQDNLNWLESEGASLSYFSPLNDRVVPDVECLYLPGGYPELHLDQLAVNQSMKNSIGKHVESGKTVYAECGGMLYLLESLETATAQSGEMVGVIAGHAKLQKRLTALGYQQLELDGETARGHTFHYSKLESQATVLTHARKLSDGGLGEPVYRVKNVTASYLHLYFPSAPDLIASFLGGAVV